MPDTKDWPFIASLHETEALLRGHQCQARRFPSRTWDTIMEAWRTREHDLQFYLWVREAGYRLNDKTLFVYEIQTTDARLARRESQGFAEPPFDATKEVALTTLPDMDPPIKCPRWASRMTLHLRDIRLVRLQDMTEQDMNDLGVVHARGEFSFQEHWDAGHNDPDKPGRLWDDNPEVYRVEFDVLHRNVGPKSE